MTEQERKAAADMLAAALRGFPSSKADEETIYLYVIALDDMPFQILRGALLKLLKTARFFPSIAEIYEAAESLQTTADGSGYLDAGQAWEEAMTLVRTCGAYKPWVYKTPELKAAVKRFGKTDLLYLTTDGVNTARAQFMRIYGEIVRRKKERKQNEELLTKLGMNVKEIDGAKRLKLVGSGS